MSAFRCSWSSREELAGFGRSLLTHQIDQPFSGPLCLPFCTIPSVACCVATLPSSGKVGLQAGRYCFLSKLPSYPITWGSPFLASQAEKSDIVESGWSPGLL